MLENASADTEAEHWEHLQLGDGVQSLALVAVFVIRLQLDHPAIPVTGIDTRRAPELNAQVEVEAYTVLGYGTAETNTNVWFEL